MNLSKLQAFIAPVATPVAPALLLANEMYQVMVLAQIPWWIALIGAIVAIIGLESSGALTCFMAVKSWQRKNWLAMGLAILGAVVYTAIVFCGLLIMPTERARIFSVMVFVTLVAYLAYALWQTYNERDKLQTVNVQQNVDLMRERTKYLNAQIRLEKVRGEQQVDTSILSSGHTEHETIITKDGKRVYEWLDANGLAAARKLAKELNLSPTTTSKWIKLWQQKRR